MYAHVYMAYGTSFLRGSDWCCAAGSSLALERASSASLKANQTTSMEIKSPVGIILDAAEPLLLHLLLPTAYLLSYSADFMFT